jgi:hypothetical protein
MFSVNVRTALYHDVYVLSVVVRIKTHNKTYISEVVLTCHVFRVWLGMKKLPELHSYRLMRVVRTITVARLLNKYRINCVRQRSSVTERRALEYLGEQVFSGREISLKTFLNGKICFGIL